MKTPGILGEHVRSALAQVLELQQKVIERQRFKGFSGPTRAMSGTLALFAAAIMSAPFYPATSRAHLIGWGLVFVLSLFVNGIALLYWFFFDPMVRRDFRRLMPLLDVIPPLFVGGMLTLTVLLHDRYDYLFGIWMCMFGLANLASRYVLPRTICLVGLFYVLCGGVWLLAPHLSFLNPWPMGIVFFAGEWAGGMILHFDDKRFGQRVALEEEWAASFDDQQE